MNATKIPPTLLAVLAVGAVWWLTQRRAGAVPLYGNAPAAASNGAVQRYGIGPSGITPAVPAPTPLQSVLSFASQLIGRPSSSSSSSTPATAALARAYAQGGPSMGVYGVDTGEVIRPIDYVPPYIPDSQGEAAAQAYYISNPDEFISNPPSVYNTNAGVDAESGWLDRQ